MVFTGFIYFNISFFVVKNSYRQKNQIGRVNIGLGLNTQDNLNFCIKLGSD